MRKGIQYVVTTVIVACMASPGYAQVTPQGQGGKLVLWTALEIDQQLSKCWSSQTTFGIGRHSDLNSYSILEHKDVFTIRQGFSYELNKHFTTSFTAMYAQRS